jgi:hypothetical protein
VRWWGIGYKDVFVKMKKTFCDYCGKEIISFYVTDICIKNSIGNGEAKSGEWHIECIDGVLRELCKND